MEPTSLVAWTLIHFVWQGAIVALGAAVAFAALGRSRPTARYGVGVAALATMALLPVATAIRLDAPSGTSSAASFAGTDAAVERAPSGAAPESGADSAPRGSTVPTARPEARAAGATFSAPGPESAVVERIRAWGDSAAPSLVRIWLFGVLILSLRLLSGWLGVRRLVREAVQEPSELLRARFDEIARRVGSSRAVRLVESAIVRTPAAVGFLKPVVLWPVSLTTGLSVPQIDALLAHELAHLRRHDYLVNLAQTILETALFYHPAVWWLSKRVRDERELCCDDVAASVAGDRREFAGALVALEAWRSDGLPIFATAATGGSLKERVRRLVLAEPVEKAHRSRFAALPLALAAVAGILTTSTTSGAQRTTEARDETAEESPVEAGQADWKARPQAPTGSAKPSAVLRATAGTTVDAGVAWAAKEAAARGDARYWVGYTVSIDPNGPLFYLDRAVPISFGNGSIMTGHVRFTRADRIALAGAPISESVGDLSPETAVVLLGFRAGSSGAPGALDRVHAANSTLPVHFDGRPLYWIGNADDAGSIGLVKALMTRAVNDSVREDLVAVAAIHTDAARVFDALRGWIDSGSGEKVRVAAVEEMGSLSAKDAVATLDRLARRDASRDLRREAAEALGEQPDPEATKVLAALARTAGDEEVSREATESLAERRDPRAFDELVAIVWDRLPREVRREAVESLAETGSPRVTAELKRIVASHADPEIRREAIETLGETGDVEGAVEAIESAIESDASSAVREEGVETLGDLGDERAMRALNRLATTSRDTEIRRGALESLWEKGDRAQAMSALEAMLGSPDSRAARAAIELLGDLDSSDAVARLSKVAATDPRAEVQREAVEAMGNLNAPDVVSALERIARTHPNAQVRVTAVEALDHDEHDGVVAVLERLGSSATDEQVQVAAIEALSDGDRSPTRIAWLSDRLDVASSRRVRMAILDSFEEMEDAGVDPLIRVVRTSIDPEVKKRAIEILAESSNPKAKAELRRILER